MAQQYILTEQGDANHLDSVTRERLYDAHAEVKLFKLVKIGWFFFGMIAGNILHDGIFHYVVTEQIIK